ncbi:DUF2905 domain-containing protein [Jeotgalibacillus proteolyticus]|uniref:DUF2905 domain-containing protein n=1 Tax=Jeotgalibacillus proteolyticus TaxID=2082395 RepID=A0A2S5GEV1_9BACL|nr:DUF2905 domain-containing protein [Jeotgalibacillus proteolyticus]PPA71526.1 DUF2905 domain-containing protein [Jeotgalibacillus proteolyticus]
MSLPKTIMLIGAVLLVAGFIMQFIKLGRLPGDIVIKRENMTVYFPIVTSIVISLILTGILFFIGRFR